MPPSTSDSVVVSESCRVSVAHQMEHEEYANTLRHDRFPLKLEHCDRYPHHRFRLSATASSELCKILRSLRKNKGACHSDVLLNSYESILVASCWAYPKSSSVARRMSHKFDVFLGGACNPTTWRMDSAIPYFEEHSISYYNPQSGEWCADLVNVEAKAKSSSRVLLFVFETWRTRAVSSFIEVSFLAAQQSNLVIVFSDVSGAQPPVINEEQTSKTEYICLLQAKAYLLALARQHGIPLFFSLSEALSYVKALVLQYRAEERLQEHLSQEERALIAEVSSVCKVFQSLPQSVSGFISPENEKIGLQRLGAYWPCRSLWRRRTASAVGFPQFCLHYVAYIRRHRVPRFDLDLTGATTHESHDSHLDPTLSARTSLGKGTELLEKPTSSWPDIFYFQTLHPSEAVPASCVSCSSLHTILADEPTCNRMFDLYLSVSDLNSHPLKASTFLHRVKAYLRRSNPNLRTNLDICSTGTLHASFAKQGPFSQWSRTHSRLLLFYVTNTSLNVTQMLEAAYCIGLGFNVVLCVELMHSHVDYIGSIGTSSSTSSSPTVSKCITFDQPSHGSTLSFSPSDTTQFTTVRQISCPNDVKLSFCSTPIGRVLSKGYNERSPTSPQTSSINGLVKTATSIDSGLGSLPSPVVTLRDACFKDADRRLSDLMDARSCDKRYTLPHLDPDWCSYSQFTIKDHNRGRTYLTSIGNEMHIPVTHTFADALVLCESLLLKHA